MLKRLLLIFQLICGVSTVFALDFVEGGVRYQTISNTQVSVNGIDKSVIKNGVTIPSTVTHEKIKYHVVSISNNAFSNNKDLQSVGIPSGVTSIGSGAFSGCTALASAGIPNSVTQIGSGAFSGCVSIKSVAIANSVATMGNCVFSGCTGLESASIGSSLQILPYQTFYGCTALKSVNLGKGLTKIEDSALQNAPN